MQSHFESTWKKPSVEKWIEPENALVWDHRPHVQRDQPIPNQQKGPGTKQKTLKQTKDHEGRSSTSRSPLSYAFHHFHE